MTLPSPSGSKRSVGHRCFPRKRYLSSRYPTRGILEGDSYRHAVKLDLPFDIPYASQLLESQHTDRERLFQVANPLAGVRRWRLRSVLALFWSWQGLLHDTRKDSSYMGAHYTPYIDGAETTNVFNWLTIDEFVYSMSWTLNISWLANLNLGTTSWTVRYIDANIVLYDCKPEHRLQLACFWLY
ncbi:uncharacterized protein H6S33_005435 [Morchella sextelata]|uniref:uncharacterized protein n=1 Tax=Morchella sextelata TaxID=1174677 RepID=UPI001D0481CE|nr:uncharacterized protein H6S33_005435 [Morchella sextelata]KAH0613549.1 hypothetical protein H6S33_005435 [Morchella sextelata]